jgi:hypothetical protein
LNVLGADAVGVVAAIIDGSGLNVTLREGFRSRGEDSVAMFGTGEVGGDTDIWLGCARSVDCMF